MAVNEIIADSVVRERKRAQLSMSSLATKAGIAKSTLSLLEAGKGNPSVETLWAIANALQVPFSFLFEEKSSNIALIRANEGAALISDQAKYLVTSLSPSTHSARRDLYRVSLELGSIRESEPHPPGTREHVIVCRGELRVGPQGALEQLGPGDYYCFPSDVAHSYEAIQETATFLLVMET